MVPPKLDWDRPPWNRWAFQHIREILPTVEVWRGAGHRSKLPEAATRIDDLAYEYEGRETTLSAHLDETYTDGFLILKHGAIVHESYFNGMTPRSLHLSQSMAKSVTATVCGILVGRGLIDVAAPVTRYLPELEATGWRGATVQHVLDMTTGVRFSEEYTDPMSDIGQVDVASGWKPPPPQAPADFPWPAHMWELILGLKEEARPHGERFEYRSIETDVLAFLMERVTGRRLAQLVSEELWQKIGADESACFTVDPAGYALADGGFNATLRDYARFGQLILEVGAASCRPTGSRRRAAAATGPISTTRSPTAPTEPVLDQGQPVTHHHGARRLRPAHPDRLRQGDGGGEAVDLSRIHKRESFQGDAGRHRRHRGCPFRAVTRNSRT